MHALIWSASLLTVDRSFRTSTGSHTERPEMLSASVGGQRLTGWRLCARLVHSQNSIAEGACGAGVVEGAV